MQHGRCLCGAVVFGVEGPPNDIINCHCNFCQRATGSAFLVETMFDLARFHLLKGEPRVYTHVSAVSGKKIHIHFCGTCGTKTHMRFERFPGSVGIFSGTFDTCDWFERSVETAPQFFLSTAPLGTVLPAGFEIYDAHFWQADGVPATPQVFDAHLLVTEQVRAESLARLEAHEDG